jgi:hypothetical protein
VISSATLTKGQVVTINTLGLFGTYLSEREKDCPGNGLDGYTYFGSLSYVTENKIDLDGNPLHEENDPNAK